MHKLEMEEKKTDDKIANWVIDRKEGLFIENAKERDKHKVDTENKERPT